MKIWKHIIPLEGLTIGRHDIAMPLPRDCQILSVGIQDDKPVLWEMHEEQNTQDARWIFVYMTGEGFTLPKWANFLGTIQLSGPFVLHVFVDDPPRLKKLTKES